MASSIHSASRKGFENASSYDRYRPPYSPQAVNSLLEHLQVDGLKGARITDLAAGSGKFTELISGREEQYEIYAVEPHDGMRAELEKKQLKGVKVFAGMANDMEEIKSQCMDGVVAAQAFHWFANMEALEEIYRVLIPGGVFAMIWNVEDYNSPKSWELTTDWERKLNDIVWSSGNDHARFRHEQWRQVFEKQLETTPLSIQAANPLFSLPLGEESFKFTHWLSREAVWERFHTLSQFAVLEGKELGDTMENVFKAMDGPDVEMNEKGEVALHGHTFSVWTTAIPGAPLKNSG